MRLSKAPSLAAASVLLLATSASASMECYEGSVDLFGSFFYPGGTIAALFDETVNTDNPLEILCTNPDDPTDCDYNGTDIMAAAYESCSDLDGQVVLEDYVVCGNKMKLVFQSEQDVPDFIFKNAPLCLPKGDVCNLDGKLTDFLETISDTGALKVHRLDLLFSTFLCENTCQAADMSKIGDGECDTENNSAECAEDGMDCYLQNLDSQYPDCVFEGDFFGDFFEYPLGDGICSWDLNNPECEYDGGRFDS